MSLTRTLFLLLCANMGFLVYLMFTNLGQKIQSYKDIYSEDIELNLNKLSVEQNDQKLENKEQKTKILLSQGKKEHLDRYHQISNLLKQLPIETRPTFQQSELHQQHQMISKSGPNQPQQEQAENILILQDIEQQQKEPLIEETKAASSASELHNHQQQMPETGLNQQQQASHVYVEDKGNQQKKPLIETIGDASQLSGIQQQHGISKNDSYLQQQPDHLHIKDERQQQNKSLVEKATAASQLSEIQQKHEMSKNSSSQQQQQQEAEQQGSKERENKEEHEEIPLKEYKEKKQLHHTLQQLYDAGVFDFVHQYGSQLCKGLNRPNVADVPRINNKWQYFMLNHTRTNLVAMYYDDRSLVSGPCLQGFAALVCPIEELPQAWDYHAMLWYKGVENPLPVKCWTNTKPFNTNWWTTDNFTHGVTEFRCLLPTHGLIPTHVSLSDRPCHLQPNLIEVVVPKQPQNGQIKEVSACVKCLFGNLTESMAPFLVSWFESLKLFGMPEIYWDEDILEMAPVIRRIFEYYKDIKFLYMRKFRNNLYETLNPRVDEPLSQSVVMSVSNDCYYRNLKKYKFILHIDLDEVLVPRRHNTYAEVINDFFNNHQELINSTCLAARSAPFYRYLKKGNSQAPDYAPVLQYTYRMPPIIPGHDGINEQSSGVRKAFINTRTCTMLFIHGCHGMVPGYKGNAREYFPVEDILVHHYRQTCKGNSEHTGQCPPKDYHNINDTILWDKFGPKLSSSINQVLKKVGYL